MPGDAPRIRIGPWRVPALAPALAISLALHAAALTLVAHVLVPDHTKPRPPRITYSAGEPVRVLLRKPSSGASAPPAKHALTPKPPEPLPPRSAQAHATPPRTNAEPARSTIHARPNHIRAESAHPPASRLPEANAPAPAALTHRHLSLQAPATPSPASADRPEGLTHAARVVHRPQPRYPPRAVRLGYEGTAKVEITVLPTGEPAGVALIESTGHRILDDAAVEAAERGTYQPARSNGRPLEATIIIPFTFALQDRPR